MYSCVLPVYTLFRQFQQLACPRWDGRRSAVQCGKGWGVENAQKRCESPVSGARCISALSLGEIALPLQAELF